MSKIRATRVRQIASAQLTNFRIPLLIRLLIWWPLLFATNVSSQQRSDLQGIVFDANRTPIVNARIEFQSANVTHLTNTNQDGRFKLNIIGQGVLLVSYPGFAPVNLAVGTETPSEPLQIYLSPAPLVERITVGPAGTERISALPNSQFLISRQDLQLSGSLALDDVLREAPGFTLFRRTGSLFANPTSQGVSLRGVGASGASRATVLLDGVPLNTPFGGWVYWDRVPKLSIESVEIVSGATSDLYGSGALGGVVNIVTSSQGNSFASVESTYGNEDTSTISLNTGFAKRGWSLFVAGQGIRTSGYIPVRRDQRGLVDSAAGTRDISGALRISKRFGETGNFFVRGSTFGESRMNGTPLQINDTRITFFDVGADWNARRANYFSARVYGSDELFNQNFSSVAANRNSESLTNRQRNPSQQLGFAGQWRMLLGSQIIAAGIESRDVRGHSAETTFNALGPTANIDAGGRQRTFGFFGQAALHFGGRWSVIFGARLDRWVNAGGFSNRKPLPLGTPIATLFPDRSETALSPRISLLRSFGQITISASAYRAFRAPTLNELYRSFRVGNVVTNANAGLRAERLAGGELGASLQTWSQRLIVRGVGFWSEIDEPVANVTLSTSPTVISRQRQNLGRIRARGVEVSAGVQLPKNLQVSAEYLLTDSVLTDFPANRALQGLRVPQITKNQFNLQLGYVVRKWTAGFQARFVGRQFEDDQNLLPLPGFFTLDGQVSYSVSPHVKVFTAAQNLTGKRYEVGRTTVVITGPPVLGRVGIRLDFR